MIKLNVSAANIAVEEKETLTEGRVGLLCQFRFSPDWDGLVKTAVFDGVDSRDVILMSDTVAIPAECLSTEGYSLSVGVYGKNGAGDIVIPTVYATVGKIQRSAYPSGKETAEPTPDVVAQIQQAAANAEELARSVREDADLGKFNGGKGEKGDKGDKGADGKSAYAYAVEGGFTGTETEFTAKLAQELPTVDDTLTQTGQSADAAEVGARLSALSEEIDDKANKTGWTPDRYIGTDTYGNLVEKDVPAGGGTGTVTSVNGVSPDENGNVTVEVGQPTEEQIGAAVDKWLGDHPEATTTVADGSITREKMSNNAVAPNNTTFFNESTRVFWSGTVTSQTKIDVSGRSSAFMRMHPNGSGCNNTTVAKYAVSNINFYDSTDTVIGTIAGNPLPCDATNADGIYTITKMFEIPAGTSYMIFTINNYYGGIPTLILATEEIADDEDITFTIVGRYKEFISGEIVESSAFVGKVNNAVEVGKSETLNYVAANYLSAELSATSNILDYTDLVEGFISYNEKKGIYYDKSQTWCVDMYSTKPLPVEASTEYTFVSFTDESVKSGVSAVLELDADMNYVNYTQTSSLLKTITTQADTAYIITTYKMVGMKNIWIGKSTEVPIYYIPYVKKVTDQTIFVRERNIISGLAGKKWNALGDSWTAGDTGYVSRIAEKTGMIARNYGIVSSTISEMGDGGYEPMCVRYADMDDDADLITVMGGINDHTSVITAIDYGDINSTDTATFYGGWNVLLSGLRAKYPNAIILVFTNGDCTPQTRGDAEGRVEAIKNVCAKYRIPCLDILHNIGYTYKDYQTDMVHLTPTQMVNNLTPLVYNFIKWHFMP